MERTRALRMTVGVVTVIMVASVVIWSPWSRRRSNAGPPIPGDGKHPLVVEVLNASTADGLARDVTRKLRRAGIDVVYFGGAGRMLDSTTILVRRGDSSAVTPIREALGAGRIHVDPDPRLLLDASVLVGADLAHLLRLNP